MKSEKTLPDHLLRRSASRLAAVQVIFQHEQHNGAMPVAKLINDLSLQLLDGHVEREGEDNLDYDPDMGFLTELAEGVTSHLTEIDAEIIPRLANEWRYDRIDPVLRALLRVAIFELKYHTATPAKVVVSEYVDVAAAFGPEEETAFVNGLLDSAARDLRTDA